MIKYYICDNMDRKVFYQVQMSLAYNKVKRIMRRGANYDDRWKMISPYGHIQHLKSIEERGKEISKEEMKFLISKVIMMNELIK